MASSVVVFTFDEATEDGSGVQQVQEEWSEEHAKLLYMISRYARCAENADEYEGWLRHIPLLVLIYEGCIQGALAFDYAPSSVRITRQGQSRQLWLNVSQEGKSATDDLRRKKMLNGLKLAAKDFEPVTAYQASKRGMLCVAQIPQRLKDAVDSFIYTTQLGEPALLHVHFAVVVGSANDESTAKQQLEAQEQIQEDRGERAMQRVKEDDVPDATPTRKASSFRQRLGKMLGTQKTESGQPPSPTRHSRDKWFRKRSIDGGTDISACTRDDHVIAAGDAITTGKFYLQTADATFSRQSNVTDVEDVSYVSSPFLPQCVRNPRNQRSLSCNASRAAECATGASTIQDDLDEAIKLGYVSCMVGEWIPFGANQIVALNERLGARERCQGGLFTAMIDKQPDKLCFECEPGLTDVTILDYDFVHFINFEAAIHYPEDEGIVQVENFGMHLSVDGTVFYGLKVEAIMDHASDNISVDMLARMLVDVHQDSSLIMNDLLSSYQSAMLDTVFLGDKKNRGKFNMLIADTIEPFLPAAEYLDGSANENELQQLLGTLHNAYDLGEDGVLIIGRDGLLVAGSNSKDYEPLLVCYLSLLCCEMFLRHFFMRIFIADDLMKQIRGLIDDYQSDPNHVARIRVLISDASRDLILLSEIVEYMRESLQDRTFPGPPADAVGKRLYELLDVRAQHQDVMLRTTDLIKLVEGGQHELHNLQQMCDVLNTQQLEGVCKGVQANTKYLVDASAANERSSASLEVMQVILAGSFAFDIVDRISGGTLNIVVPDWVNTWLTEPIISVPFLWFFLNMAWLVVVCVGLLFFMRYASAQSNGALVLRICVDKRINLERMHVFLSQHALEVVDAVCDPQRDTLKCSWIEADEDLWCGMPPKIELQLDQKNGFLLQVIFHVNERKTDLSPLEDELCRIFFKQLEEAGVLESEANGGFKKIGEAGPANQLSVEQVTQSTVAQ